LAVSIKNFIIIGILSNYQLLEFTMAYGRFLG